MSSARHGRRRSFSPRYTFWIGAGLLALSAGWNFGARADTGVAQPPSQGFGEPRRSSPEQPASGGGTFRSADDIDAAVLKAFQWRSIGPLRGGRSIAVSGVKGRPREAYFGAVGGGLWKTTDGGANWTPVTDGQIKSASVGAVAVSESNPDTVFIGMGESCIRGNIMPGDGVYKSTDAGKTWTHVGFADSDAISKIRIHPTNPDIVFVADFGKYSVPSDERGVFKTADGGKTWKKVLFKDNKTGAADVAIDRKNPNVMFAALWEAYRIEYQMSSGGPGSGLYKSTDGGETWREITRHQGLPSGLVGKVSIGISGADSNRVYALIENENGGLFSSDDAGATWKLMNAGRNIRQRAFYYTHVFADPNNKDTVYMLNTSAFRSTDGGKTLANIGNGTHGDHHDFWIDPDDSSHVMDGNDGGGAISYNVATTPPAWTDEDFPTAQMYHVITTKHAPYHVCGAQQDNSTLCVGSNTTFGRGGGGGGGRGNVVDPYQAGGGEPGYIAPDPRDPDLFYSGANNGSFLTRLNRRTGEVREVGPYPRFFSGEPASALVERWQWTYPIIFSPVDPNVLYTSSQHVWKTTNGGQTWDKISGDLTRHDPKTMTESGGPITHDMNSPEVYATVYSLAPGKTDVNVIWAGSDDGVVSVTRDGGKNWATVTPSGMPDLGRVSQIDASSFDAGTAYVAVKKPLLNDFSPYIFRTHDYGRTWTKIVNGIPAKDYTHAVREDPVRRGMLYAGTQHGFYLSMDDGDHWRSLSLNLPDTPIHDIWVEGNDVAITAHGRSFYILDDVGPLRQYGNEVTSSGDTYLFKPTDAIRSATSSTITYWLKKPPQKMTLDIVDSKGQVVRSINGAVPPAGRAGGAGRAGEAGGAGGAGQAGGRGDTRGGAEGEAAPNEADEEGGGRGRPQTANMSPGVQRFTWDLQSQPVVNFPGMVLWGATTNGPTVLPGTYQARLTVDGKALAQPFAVKKHPWRNVSDADLQEQFELASHIRDSVNEANNAIIQIRRIKRELADRVDKSKNADVKAIAEQLQKELTAVEEDVYQVRNQSNQDPLNFPIKTNNRLASLLRVVETGDGKPLGNVGPIFNDLKAELKAETDRLQRALTTFLPRFNQQVQRLGLGPISEK
ncbi:MAG: glycosyl hydrolase [Acidobacteria bacterium 13_1_40CM_4_65_8]|nr:MAG: glycosyl hydrolase [Acidobacteria bacterium 13_1_40CM_4_65_8]